ncbi:MAG: hypothetical protein EA368_17370 [Leptolyngbya sp. DLM2.Bin27]|nr:MAG: hypothetical protein EA368_17370 [Leptolyngbya sp. DLM2.Bin27]
MSNLPPSLQNHVETFVRDIRVDEIKDEQERLKQHLIDIQKEVALTLQSLRVETVPAPPRAFSRFIPNPRYTVPLWLFTLLGVWALGATLVVGLVLGSRLPPENLTLNREQTEYQIQR